MTLPSQSVLLQNELLPYQGPGRPYVCNSSEVEAVFLFSERRKTLWQVFRLWREQCQSVFGECRYLVNGSFVTSKPDPHDIDVAFLVDQTAVNNAQLESTFTLVTNPVQLTPTISVRNQPFGGMIDSFFIQCEDVEHATIALPKFRYWDDLWSRVNNEKNYLKTEETRKGYLEVRQ